MTAVSPGHEERFRATFRLRDDLADDPYWQAAYECAATTKLTIPEINAVGPGLVRRDDAPPGDAKDALVDLLAEDALVDYLAEPDGGEPPHGFDRMLEMLDGATLDALDERTAEMLEARLDDTAHVVPSANAVIRWLCSRLAALGDDVLVPAAEPDGPRGAWAPLEEVRACEGKVHYWAAETHVAFREHGSRVLVIRYTP